MRGRYTIIHYQMHLKEYSIGIHLCNNKVMLRISFFISLKYYAITFLQFKRRQIGVYGYNYSYTTFSIFNLPLLIKVVPDLSAYVQKRSIF